MNKLIITLLVLVIAIVCIDNYQYSIPQLIPQDYDCELHPSIISESKPFYFEESQHYVNRLNKEIQEQIEEVCN